MRVEPVPALLGHVAVPGDKSISHRAILVGAICDGETSVAGVGRSADTEGTSAAAPARGGDGAEREDDAAGGEARRSPGKVSVRPAPRLTLGEIEIPGDFSSAAPLLVAAAIVPGSELTVHGVGLNSRRTGLLDVLERMGARIAVYNRRSIGGEPAGDIEIRAAELVGTSVTAGEVPVLVDELPLFALAACHAHGDSVVRGAQELRAKESDRIAGVVEELRKLGAHIRATRDGFRIRGVPARLRGGT